MWTNVDQFQTRPCSHRTTWKEGKNLRIRNDVQDSCGPVSPKLCEPELRRANVVAIGECSFQRVDPADPVREASCRENCTPHESIVEVAMGIDQTGQDSYFTEIDHSPSMRAEDLVSAARFNNDASVNHKCPIFNGRPMHRHKRSASIGNHDPRRFRFPSSDITTFLAAATSILQPSRQR